MPLFQRDHRSDSPHHARVYAAFEIAYTSVDFTAALTFVIGSVMFLSEEWTRTGTYLFIVGSICFALKPTIRLWRELKLAAMGNPEDVASRLESGS